MAITVSADAERRLKELDPWVHAKVSNLGSPELQVEDGVTKYTWTYVTARGNAAKVGRYTLGFNSSGDIVNVNSQ